jgi:hypothetical protein
MRHDDYPAPESKAAWYAIWIGPLIALALYAPTLGGTFLSDDFLVNTMLHHGASPTVNWSEIFADFTRAWAGLDDAHLYRPLVSVSFALTIAIGGFDPFPFHVTNVIAHMLATLACALLCASCSPRRASLAAGLGGLVFAMHPIAAEPVCWIASRTAGLQVMFATASMACFARHLRSGGRGTMAGAIAFFATALLCKESAVLVPFSCVALDLLVRGRRAPGRLRLHAPMFAVLAAYFGLRLVVLGALIGGGDQGALLHGNFAGNLRDKFAILLAPVGNSLPEPFGFICGGLVLIGAAALVLPGFRRRESRLFAVFGIAWIALYFAPTFRLTVNSQNLTGSRMVYGAVVVLAIYITAVVVRSASGRRLVVGTSLLLAGLLCLGGARMVQYLLAFEDMRLLQTSLAERATFATPERPLAFVSAVPPARGIPFLNCNALYPLAEIPVAKVDTPSISLGFVWEPVPLSESLQFDLGTVRAMREQGAWLLDWIDHAPPLTPRFELRPAYRRAPTLPSLTQKTRPGWFLADGPLDPWDVEVVEVEVVGPCTGGRLEWLYTSTKGEELKNVQEYSSVIPSAQFQDAARSVAFGPGERRGDKTVFHVDVSHNLTFIAAGYVGRFAGLHAVLEGEGATATAVRLRSRVEQLELPARLRGVKTKLAATAETMRAPEMPDGADRMTLFLIGPDTTIPIRVEPGPFALSEGIQDAIAIILRSSRQKRWYFYFEANGVKSYRSRVDWVVFEN